MKTSKTAVAKTITRYVVGGCVSFTITSLVVANTNPIKAKHKAQIIVGAFALGWIVSDYAEQWTDNKIDEIVSSYNAVKGAIKDAKTEAEIITLPTS